MRAAARVLCLAGVAVALAGGSRPAAGALSPEEKRLLAPLRGAKMMTWVRRLSGPEYEGRKAGTPGAARAVAALSNHFRRIGLEELPGAPGYRQPFTMSFSLLRSRWDRRATLTNNVGGAPLHVVYPGFPSMGYTGRGRAVLVGHGIHRPDRGWDDYRGVALKGNIAVLWDDHPSGITQPVAARCRAAWERGAIGCLVITARKSSEDGEPIDRGVGRLLSGFPVIRLHRESAARLLGRPVPRPATLVARRPAPPKASAKANASPGGPWQAADGASAKQWAPATETRSADDAKARATRPAPGPRLGSVSLYIPPSIDPARPVDNILGALIGSDPELKEEWILFSAHLDHLGQEGRVYYPGADDDASGVAVVCAVAEALLAQKRRPRRSILFALWNGEECGLLGSRHFVNRPVVPVERIAGMLQLDMVGAGETDAFLTSPRRGPAPFFRSFESAARVLGLRLPADNVRGVSDHTPFLRAGVPAIVVTTAGVHPHYHTVRDRPEGVRPAALENCARLSALTVWRLANEAATARARGGRRVAWR